MAGNSILINQAEAINQNMESHCMMNTNNLPTYTHAMKQKTCPLTVIVPAFNEAKSIADTIHSLKAQILQAEEIIVVDDFSTDGTGDIARACGVTVIRPPRNTGSKAGAQNFALDSVNTEFTMAIDADTVLAPDAIEKLMPALNDSKVAAACGLVLPRHVRTLWERGRYIEYLFAFSFFKVIQNHYERPLISSGCFSAYRTQTLKAHGGWNTRTMAEDMDLTWTFYQAGYGVKFVPEAVCYPIEPHNYHFMGKQLRRWSHGFIQNVRLHWRGIMEDPFLRSTVAVALWDASIASLAFLLLLPLLAIFVSPLFLLGYIIDFPIIVVPVVYKAFTRGETLRALASIPCFFVLRWVNGLFMFRALWAEVVLKRPLMVYEKGH